MNPIVLCGLAVALAMDAFTVAVASSASINIQSRWRTLRIAVHFGFFQFMMPVVGWLAGRGLLSYICGVDHWIAFGILAYVGCRMIRESSAIGHRGGYTGADPTEGMALLVLAFATSLDALAVGLTLPLIGGGMIRAAIVIGVVTFFLTVIGVEIGPRVGGLVGKWAEVIGGAIIIAIGVKILLGHLIG